MLKAVPPSSKAGATAPVPPADMGPIGRDLWSKLVRDYNISDEHGLAVLAVACRAADRAESCRLAVLKTGLVVKDRFRQTRPHPLLAVERAARAQMLQALKQLSLPIPED
jgi:phage terminase small subunit